ncbi:alpha-galactosidase [Streptomyces fuscigenes]|uniref:alpha-galactosidase n=1 Tax=Streptomyces fuscigenes TaxID=1528880 RepID=UPI001F28D4F5|nr:alpha-galactosidase [Streptomyces fuscigenes]MCF3962290.1 alpha-galactosidase [Streptomyces fuscigenes]
MTRTTARIAHLRAAGVSFAVELGDPLPRVLHWGADLGELGEGELAALSLTADGAVLNSSTDAPRRFTVWPTEADGWSGTPAHEGHRGGFGTTPRPRLTGADLDADALVLHLDDDVSGLTLTVAYRLDAAGVLGVTTTLARPAAAPDDGVPYDLAAVTTLLPVPGRATEILDFTGKWCRERVPQRSTLLHGGHVRAVRRGRPGHESPHLLTLGVPGFGFRTGEVWGLHVAWSGNQRWLAERLPEGAGVDGAVLGGGELLAPGEIRLAPGESYTTPECLFVWSDEGLDGLADRFHDRLRARGGHPATPRPLTLNTWEAVYFDHRLERLLDLADRAAEVGVERLVLDDGWFAGRRDDTAGLGDWTVDEAVWPDGLGPLVERVHGHGMQFGLWVEPEMVNLDSAMAREHPDWILGPSRGLGPSMRHQYAVNLANEDAWNHLLKALDAVVARYRVDYLKWDYNRDLLEAVHRGADGRDRPGVHAQTEALYRLLDALRERHPGLEIESCSSGGGRVDLGILARTDRVWPSDCNDPVERQAIQRWTAQLLPPELIGTHVGGPVAHTTGRATDASFRLATALFGHAGIEDDLTARDAEEIARLGRWAELYKEKRALLHTGRTVRADLPDEALLLNGVVARDGSEALYSYARVETSADGQPGRVRLPGLDPSGSYRVSIREEVGLPVLHQVAGPAWFAAALQGRVDLPGTVLATTGIPLPNLAPGQALLLDVARVR